MVSPEVRAAREQVLVAQLKVQTLAMGRARVGAGRVTTSGRGLTTGASVGVGSTRETDMGVGSGTTLGLGSGGRRVTVGRNTGVPRSRRGGETAGGSPVQE